MSGHRIIARIPKGRRSEIRISFSTYEGRTLCHVRLWVLAKDGNDWVATPKGICLDPTILPSLIEGLRRASAQGHGAAPREKLLDLGIAAPLDWWRA